MPKHILWHIIVSSSLYASRVTCDQGVVLRRIGGRGHFRSRDKNGAQTIRSAVAKKPLLYANCTALSFTEPELLPIEDLHCGKRELRVFLREIVESIKILRSYRTSDADDGEIFWPIIDYSSLYATGVIRIQSVVLLRIGECGHFRSRDKDGGHTIRSATAENPQLYANFMAISFIEPELLPIEVLHCRNREFRVFLRKIVKNIKFFCLHPKKNVAVAKTRHLSHKTRKSVKRCDLYRWARNRKVTEGGG